MGDYLSSQVCEMFQCVWRRLTNLNRRLTTAEGEIDVLQTFQNSHIGAMLFSIRTADFDGWLLCDGRAVSRDTYAVLFTLIGTQFGSGDGLTTFNLPDGRDRVVGVKGATHAIADTTGSETATLTTTELPAHTHTGTTDSDGIHTHTSNATGGGLGLVISDGHKTAISTDDTPGELNLWDPPYALSINSSGAHTHTFTTNSTGSGAAFSIMQPTIYVGSLFIYAGV